MTKTVLSQGRSGDIVEEAKTFTAVGKTDWCQFTDKVIIQISGSATAITADIYRSSSDPANGAKQVKVETITGNPATGIPPAAYEEPGAGWWRADLTAITGADTTISLQGPEA